TQADIGGRPGSGSASSRQAVARAVLFSAMNHLWPWSILRAEARSVALVGDKSQDDPRMFPEAE
ncbi:hypothetical protein, partial [Haematobacter missouriensis]|uniref:hypothetical protein n=1 Tax=Haematobacter missouriensis TaxID=366616 RepID=UPI0023F3459A